MRRVVKSCKRGSSVYSAPCEVGRLPKSGSGNLLNKVTGEHPGAYAESRDRTVEE